MKVFISWSGEKSKAAAVALRDWLPDVIQSVEPWMSELDIQAGARWGRDVENALESTRFGIICLTKSNLNAPWVLFEAGALAKTIQETFVCPYLIDLEPQEIPAGPLTQFQAKKADFAGTLDILSTINRAVKEEALPDDRLQRAFDRSWSQLDEVLQGLPDEEGPGVPGPTADEILQEVLATVRELSRRVSEFRLPGPSRQQELPRIAPAEEIAPSYYVKAAKAIQQIQQMPATKREAVIRFLEKVAESEQQKRDDDAGREDATQEPPT